MLQYLVIVGAIIQLAGIASYIKETLKGNTKPNKITWLLWSVAPMIATFAALSAGVRLSVLPVFMSGFGPFLVFLASFVNKKSYWKLEKFDYICGLCSILALILWGITKEPAIAIIFAIASDGFAAVPTIIKSWKYPETETVTPYITGLLNSSTSFAAIKVWDFASIAFPVYLIIINISLSSYILKTIFVKKNNINKFDLVSEEIKSITKNAKDKTEYDHSQSVWQWVLKLKPDADIALQIAALGHDIDRSFENRRIKRQDFADYNEYKKQHALLSAQIMGEMLRAHNFDQPTIDKVKYLIENHEVGGEGDVEILKEADSLTFFSNFSHYRQTHTQEQTIEKIKYMYDRLNYKAKSMVNQIDFKNAESLKLFKEAINKS
jgi:hypothetical protein